MDSVPHEVPELWQEAHSRPLRFPTPTANPWRMFWLLLAASALCLALLDHRLSGFIKSHRLRGDAADLLHAAEHFGTPFGAVLILVTIWLTHPEMRQRLGRVLWVPIIAGMSANIIKLLISRRRPNAFEFEQSILASFEGMFRLGSGGSRLQGFPSAHTAFAFGFAVMLGTMWPVARKWFLCLAILVAAQRVGSCAHFPSDVCAGAALGWLIGWYSTGSGWLARLFTRVEDWWFPPRLPIPLRASMGPTSPPRWPDGRPLAPSPGVMTGSVASCQAAIVPVHATLPSSHESHDLPGS